MIGLKKLLEKMLTCVFESEVLYSGNKKTGTFSLDGNPSDYNIIIVKSMTNVEYFADICIISPYLTGNIKFDHEDGTGAYHSSLTIALGNNAMNATVNYNNVNWQLGVVQVIGIKILGGGYFLALFSTIERWWEHGDCQDLACQDIRHPATNRHKLHNHRWYWHLLGREPDHSQFCTNGTTTDNVFNNERDGLCGKLRVLEQWYIHCSNCISAKVYELHQSVRKSLNEYSAERLYVELGNDRQSVTLERGCLAC